MVQVDIPADLQAVDETDYVWALLDEARDLSVIFPGAIVVAGDPDVAAVAEVVDIVDKPAGKVVHLDLLPGRFEDYEALVRRVFGWSRSAEPDDLGEVDPPDHDPRPEPHVR